MSLLKYKEMNFFKSIILTVSSLALMAFSPVEANAQYRLPASHTRQHNSLLANQRQVGDKFRLEAGAALYNSVREREDAAELDDDVFGQYWESQMVNPYAGATIPLKANIDISGYYPPVKTYVTSNFGYRPRFGRVHKGVDLKVQVGDTVVSAFDGVVRITRYERAGYGYYVVVRHDNGMETVYGHLSRFLVKPNQRVRAGQPLALGGNTGRSTGPHLHFEARFMGLAINPAEIFDFQNHMPLSDTYAFDKAAYDKQMNSYPKGRRYAKSKGKSSRKRKARRR